MTFDASYERDKRCHDFEVWPQWPNGQRWECLWATANNERTAQKWAIEALDVTDCDYVEIHSRFGNATIRR